MPKPKTWIGELLSVYKKIRNRTDFTNEDLDQANIVVTKAIADLRQIIKNREDYIRGEKVRSGKADIP